MLNKNSMGLARYLVAVVNSPTIGMNMYVSVGYPLTVGFIAPITLKAGDAVTIEQETGNVELVHRNGFVIYRRSWLN